MRIPLVVALLASVVAAALNDAQVDNSRVNAAVVDDDVFQVDNSRVNATTEATVRGIDGRLRTVDQEATIQDDADTNRACHNQNSGYLATLQKGKYAASTFHNCFRTTDQIYEFLDKIVTQNSNVLTKFAVSRTFKGATIYGYKLSKSATATKSLYFQSLQHAREWIAGSSHLFTIASLLDDVANNKPSPADTYNLIFVPIVNIDGYALTWNGNRYQRKNANQVDLNRNWPSLPNPRPPPPSDETYPGPRPFSEPESKGIDGWLKARRTELDGFVDIHSYGGLLLYPYGDTKSPIGSGYDAKFKTLGANLQRVMGAYKPQPVWNLYLAYGGFSDYAFREFKKPSFTIEVVGNDFAAPASTIRTRGKEVYNGVVQFAKEAVTFNRAAVAADGADIVDPAN
ncbi:hypothetical protein DYB26_008933 [Aphanomyces astaci]|uniref:Peptidase M14 domain-containing protein n=1 Tax=Aphanomyces astaci TaxID=112090 RepID=A0A397A1X7_APHAT|nr:hypothetical protein DYB36_009943 [Aphanomyces astaci]RHY51313.1 hypothetical protein DYB38_009996 [Aphanomyces astaci]RHY85286.1 hypothetical protein DYB26_008933 [Aphanomyces astaci]